MRNIGIVGTGSYVPETVLTSQDLAQRMNVSESWILEKTGISERRIAAPTDATSDLARRASIKALQAAKIDASELSVIVVATGTGDQPAPATACFVQAKLGAMNALCFDVTAACSGFLYALRIAHDILNHLPKGGYALVIGADIYSRFSRYEDTKTCVLIGDGAGAVVLGNTPSGGILGCQLGTDGTLADVAQIRGGGSRAPASAATLSSGMHYLEMDGRKIRKLAADVLSQLVSTILADHKLEVSDLDLVIPHQANGVMLDEWCKLLRINVARTHKTVHMYGNTGAASVPITLDDAVRLGRIATGKLVLLVAIGGGVTWGATIIRWTY